MWLYINKPRFGSAASQLGIKEVHDGIVSLVGNRYRTIIETSSVNFHLRSDTEQDALIENFRGFLNGLNCSLQIVIRTREVDIDSFTSAVDERLKQETNPIFRNQLKSYVKFIQTLVKDNRILSRRFYIVVPYDGNEKTEFRLAKEQLAIQSDIVIKGLQRMGMTAKLLNDIEILNLFYSFYNPDSSKTKPLTYDLLRALKPIVSGAR